MVCQLSAGWQKVGRELRRYVEQTAAGEEDRQKEGDNTLTVQ